MGGWGWSCNLAFCCLFCTTEIYSSNFYTSKEILGCIFEGSPGFIFSRVYEFLQSHLRLVYFVIYERDNENSP